MSERGLRILLVQPRGDESSVTARHAYFRLTGTYWSFPPLGLMTVAGHLPREWQLRLVDEHTRPVLDTDLDWADYVLLSGLLIHKSGIVRVAERAAARGKHVILGGPFATASAEQVRGRHGIRTICLNECEPYIDQLAADMQAGCVAESYGEAGERAALERAAIPRFDLLPDLKRYAAVSLQVSRGCPFSCEFCDVPQRLGRKMRYKTDTSIAAELDALHEQVSTGSVLIVDDNLTGDPRQSRGALRAIGRWQQAHDYPFSFSSQLSLNVADRPDLLELLFEANVRTAYCGVESPSAEALREVGKVQNLQGDLCERIERFVRAGIEVVAYLMVGFDHDPPDIARQQLDFLARSHVSYGELSVPLAIDGTPLGERMAREGRLRFTTTFDTERVIESYQLAISNFTGKVTTAQVQRSYLEIIEGQFDPRAWYRRAREMVEILPERDREHQLIPMRTTAATLLFCAFTLLLLPSRLRLLGEGARLWWRTRQSWRVYRLFYCVLTTAIMGGYYLHVARGIRKHLSGATPGAGRGAQASAAAELTDGASVPR